MNVKLLLAHSLAFKSTLSKNGMHENNIIIEHFNPMSDRYQVKDGWKKGYDGFYEPQAGIFCVEALDLCIVYYV